MAKSKYDIVVVGAGSAGAIIAARLSEDEGRSVLLLEAGADYPDLDRMPQEIKYGYGYDPDIWARAFGPESPHNWAYTARATDSASEILVPRGRIVGGSSAVNAQIWLRGEPDDFERWAQCGNDGWSFEELLPCFKRIETDLDFPDEFHGADGPIRVRRFTRQQLNPDQHGFYEACLAAGFDDCPDHNHPDSTGVGPLPLNNVDGIRWSTAIGYLGPARDRKNLTIQPNTQVSRVLLEGMRAVGLETIRAGKISSIFGDEIVLSAGAIGSPHILMLSGIGPAHNLISVGVPTVHDLPGVGQNLRDHPRIQASWRTKPGVALDPLEPRLQVSLRYTAEGSDRRNDMVIHNFSAVTARPEDRYFPTDSTPIGFANAICIHSPLGSGELKLASYCPTTHPLLDYNYLQAPFDRERFRESVRICIDVANHQPLREIIAERIDPTDADIASDESLDRWLLREVRTCHHVCGTCSMGPASDEMAVVDNWGRVHGIEGLRVADASIMPDIVRANTNAAAMAIGERISDFMS